MAATSDDSPDRPRHACPCCGHRTFTVTPPGSWLTCPVCYWTDEDLADAAARTRLVEAQRCFAQLGASSPGWIKDVRPPTAREARAPDWAAPTTVQSPRERDRAALVAELREAFAGVPSAGRIPLRDSHRHDFDGDPRIDWDDHDVYWEQLPADVLDFFGRGTTPFVFGNEESFRYYMPAFMVRSLELGYCLAAVHALDLKLPPGRPPHDLPAVRLLDADQRAAITHFLEHVALYEAPAPWAERALDRIWRPAVAD